MADNEAPRAVWVRTKHRHCYTRINVAAVTSVVGKPVTGDGDEWHPAIIIDDAARERWVAACDKWGATRHKTYADDMYEALRALLDAKPSYVTTSGQLSGGPQS